MPPPTDQGRDDDPALPRGVAYLRARQGYRWFEHWVGFRGGSVDAQVANGFFSPRNPLFGLGFSQTIIGMYEELVGYALREQAGYQQVAAGIVQFLLGSVYYKHRNLLFNDSMAIRKIDEARALIKREVEGGLTPQGIAERLSSAIRGSARCSGSMPGASPAQYLSQIGSCVPKSCSIRRSSPSRRSHTGSGSRPRATFHLLPQKGGRPAPAVPPRAEAARAVTPSADDRHRDSEQRGVFADRSGDMSHTDGAVVRRPRLAPAVDEFPRGSGNL